MHNLCIIFLSMKIWICITFAKLIIIFLSTKILICIIFIKFMHNFFKFENLDMHNFCIIYPFNFLCHKVKNFANIMHIQIFFKFLYLFMHNFIGGWKNFFHKKSRYLCIICETFFRTGSAQSRKIAKSASY